MFGYEGKVGAQIAEKREQELELIKWKYTLNLLNGIYKCVRIASVCTSAWVWGSYQLLLYIWQMRHENLL